MRVLSWLITKILDWIDYQFSDALPDDETINEQLEIK